MSQFASSGEVTEEDEEESQCSNESQCASSGEETEEDEEESQCSNESQCTSSGEESEADEKESQCKLCNARSYCQLLLDTEYGGLWDSEEDYEAYLKAEQELGELVYEDSLEDFPNCAACFEHLEKKYREEEKSSRYDSSE